MNRIVADINQEQSRVALIEDGQLKEFYIDRKDHKRMVGNIYKGRVENVLPGMQAAFINIGVGKNAFLYVKDVLSLIKDHDTEKKLPPINKIVKRGDTFLVQVVKEPIGQKGARVTTDISIPGRYGVLMPFSNHVGISHRIERESERERLKHIVQSYKPQDMGVIIRTEAKGVEEEDFALDLKFLLGLWEEIQNKDKLSIAPKIIHGELELVHRTMRDVFTKNIDEFIINNKIQYDDILKITSWISPELKDRIKYFKQDIDIFTHFGITPQLGDMTNNKIWLSCGGYIIIDVTEALTVIDVNTGKFVGSKSLRDTILKTNVEAAEEIAKQLRLRNIGGIVIIDFIDMKNEEDEKKVLDKLKTVLKEDKVPTNVLGMTQLGLVELTRKKERKSIGRILQNPCPMCEGSGRVLSIDTFIIEIGDILRRNPHYKKEKNLKLILHPHSAHRIETNEREILLELKNQYEIIFEIQRDTSLSINQVKLKKSTAS